MWNGQKNAFRQDERFHQLAQIGMFASGLLLVTLIALCIWVYVFNGRFRSEQSSYNVTERPAVVRLASVPDDRVCRNATSNESTLHSHSQDRSKPFVGPSPIHLNPLNTEAKTGVF